jgi:glycosyltransferase involved in cell wall biosynthesis
LGERRTPLRSARSESLKVSIVMATYRRSHTIQRTIRQIIAQTYTNWELIVVNNSRAGDYFFDDPRIQVYRHASHASASYARNQGLTYVTGSLVCFFDDDDDMFPTYLERLVEAFTSNPDAKMVRCGMIRRDGQVNFTHATPVCCLRRELATPTWEEERRQDIKYYGDIIAANDLSEERGDIVLIPELLVRARSDPKGGLRSGRL